jgi:ubiquinone/menaquinone biosynthesis C-methylase UbiE
MKMTSTRIPFDDASFDAVVTNQVFEHVEDLDFALAEIARVLKPGGSVLSLFGHRGMWREGHCGIPFLHRFPKGSRPRVYYAAALRSIGFGYHKGTKSVMQWSEDFCTWLDKWTFYRSMSELHRLYAKHFRTTRHIEADWLKCRLGKLRFAAALAPDTVTAALIRPLGGWVSVSVK